MKSQTELIIVNVAEEGTKKKPKKGGSGRLLGNYPKAIRRMSSEGGVGPTASQAKGFPHEQQLKHFPTSSPPRAALR